MAVLEQQGESWRIVVVRTEPTPAVEQAATLASTDWTGVGSMLARARADRLVRVIGLGQTICRRVAGAVAPAGDERQIASAMSLIAEAQWGTGTPAHRRAAGTLPVGGMVAVGWAGNGVLMPPTRIGALASATWVPPIVALSALAEAAGAELAVAAERESGAIGVVAGRGEQGAVRVTREDGDDAAEWRAAVDEAASTAASAIGMPALQPLGASGAQAVRLIDAHGQPALLSGVAGVPSGRSSAGGEWLDRYGLALGAALAAVGAGPATAGLLAMTPEPFVPPRPMLVRVAESMARPARAWSVLAACAVLLLAWPLLAAWVRHERLSAISRADRSDQGEEIAASQQAEFYRLLRDRRWPMTKLLADLTGTMPLGITLESASLEVGQRLRVSGSSESAQAISDWRTALLAARIIDDVRTPVIEASSNPIKFEMNARVAQPLTIGGKTIVPLVVAPAAPPDAAPPAPGPGDRTAPEAGGAAGSRLRRGGVTPPATTKPAEAPPPLSDAEIASLDRATAMKEWVSRQKFVQTNPTLDEETKTRLTDEAAKCKAQMQAVGGGS